MMWAVLLHDAFDAELDDLPEVVQDEVLAHMGLLKQFGPALGRPRVDTLKGSRHANMKELRFDAADGVWRIAFAFDPPSGRQSCWWAVINRAAAKKDFIASSSRKRTRVLMSM
jgi:hypothetical protein